MTGTLRKRVLVGTIGAILILALLVLGVVNSPTPAPKQYQMDFLLITAAARMAAESSGQKNFSLEAMKEAKATSGGLIQGMRLIQSGEIEVDALVMPRANASSPGKRVPVKIRLLETKEPNGAIVWKCSGQPVSALPSLCSPL